jgi:disulfide bond formation protein DsbB
MTAYAEAWDERIERLSAKLPDRIRAGVEWLREPSRRLVRLVAAILFILGGIFSILPVLGLWMLPVGLALMSQDVPQMKPPLERSARWLERKWQQFAPGRR